MRSVMVMLTVQMDLMNSYVVSKEREREREREGEREKEGERGRERSHYML